MLVQLVAVRVTESVPPPLPDTGHFKKLYFFFAACVADAVNPWYSPFYRGFCLQCKLDVLKLSSNGFYEIFVDLIFIC